LEVFPPFLRANHVSQLQDAVRRTLAGELAPNELLALAERFMDLVERFEQQWGSPAQAPLSERLDPSLEEFRSALKELDAAYLHLVAAVEALQAYFHGQPGGLELADTRLTDFFALSCQAAAGLMEQLELTADLSTYRPYAR
ncbi:MAG: hypothetical protein AB1758_25645, partial [Candidatus Eremiobacterota bacterium]